MKTGPVIALARRFGLPLANLSLRMASLTGKFGLSLFIARFLDLAELGIYGIVFSLSMFMVVFIGGRIDHELCRQIVLVPNKEAARLLRDQSIFFLLNSLAVLPLFVLAGSLGMTGFDLPVAIGTWVICCLEAYANLLFVNTNALGKSLLANVAFFVRSGLWAFIAMALLLLVPSLRSLWTILMLWIWGSSVSIWVSLTILRVYRWPSLGSVPIGWSALRKALSISVLIWIGSIGLAGGTYLDRVVLSGYLDLKAVGVATFYSSFSNAVVTLVASSCLAVAVPKLVKLADDKSWPAFWNEWRGACWSIAVIGFVLCIGIAAIIPSMAFIVHKPEIYLNRYTLWALMLAAMLRLLAEGAFVGLYVLRLDVPIWAGNLAFLILSLVANIFLIGKLGLLGLGVANIVVALFLLLLRSWGLITFAHSLRFAK